MTAETDISDFRHLLKTGRVEEARTGLEVRVANDPRDREALHLLAVALQMSGRVAEALPCFERALALDPRSSSIHQNMGFALLQLGRGDEAIAAGRTAVALDPANAGAAHNLLLSLDRAGQSAEAERICREAVDRFPEDAGIVAQMGYLLQRSGEVVEAESFFRRALAIDPRHKDALHNLGSLLLAAHRDEEAVAVLGALYRVDPGLDSGRVNLGVALRNLGRLREAVAVFSQLASPENRDTQAYNLACTHLLAGRWREAWAGYELRGKVLPKPELKVPSEAPAWDGRPAPDRTLLVTHEQGFGDTLQFVRLLPAIASRVGRLILVCQAPLQPILSTMPLFAGGDQGSAILLPHGAPLPPHDMQISLMSVMHVLDLDPEAIPGRAPWLAADPDRVAAWRSFPTTAASGHRPLRIGLAWQGNPKAPVERGRSIPLAAFSPLARLGEAIQLIALQKGFGSEQAAPEGLVLHRPGPAFDAEGGAFLDTAALMATLDLVITSDTSIAHLAGALGRPVWLLLRKVPDWRWGVEGILTPWYPSMRLFRQSARGDWAGVMNEVAAEVARLVELGAPDPAGHTDLSSDTWDAAAVAALDRALDLHAQRRLADAIAAYRALARALPAHPQLLNMLGMAEFELARRGRQAALEALPIVSRSVALAPGRADFWSNFAVILDQAGLKTDQRRALAHALACDPEHEPTHLTLARLETADGKGEAALRRVEVVLRRNPGSVNALSAKGAAEYQLGRLAEAEASLRRAVTLAPNQARLLVQWGAMLSGSERHAEAARAWEAALAVDPDNADALTNLGVEERNRGDTRLALYLSRKAVAVGADKAEAWSNLAVAETELGHHPQAAAAFAKALQLWPDYADAQMGLGMELLRRGDLKAGFAHYEGRLRIAKLGIVDKLPPMPLWRGEDIAGKRIFVLAEQGFGDAFQFVRYAAVLKRMGAAGVLVGCRRKISAMLATADGVDAVHVEGEKIPQADFCAYMMSLPHYCGTVMETVPAPPSYLKAEPERVERWSRWLASRPGFRVGVVWQGNPDPKVDRGRSFPLSALEPLARLPGVRLIALQKGKGEEQIDALDGRFEVERPPADFDEGPDAFLDTAAMIMGLDLVITSDTAVAHLAGALGRRCWVVVKSRPEWRWLDEGDQSYWYPATRIFRRVADEIETAPFSGVFGRVAQALSRLVDGDEESARESALPAPERLRVEAPARRFARAVALHRAGRTDAAQEAYGELLDDPANRAEALHMLGVMALQQTRDQRALFLFRQAAASGLASADFQSNLAIALRRTGRLDEAETVLGRVLDTAPTPGAWNSLGNLLRDCDRFEEAVTAFDKALEIDPSIENAWRGAGNALRDLGHVPEAIARLEKARELSPDNAETVLDLAHARLAGGDYIRGFADYEARWRSVEMKPRAFDKPRWRGEDLSGRTLLVHGEQGLGDQIQFGRFVSEVAPRCGRVVVEVREPLVGLFAAAAWPGGNVTVIRQGDTPPDHDVEIPMMSLPVVLGTTLETLPPPTPFVVPAGEREHWRQALRRPGRLTVGLVHQGNPNARADKGRSPPLAALAPLFEVANVDLVCLQYRDGIDQIEGFAHRDRLRVLDKGLEGFASTAAVMSALDLVISCCTSSLHLAATLGVPTFAMLKANADWRWLTERDDSPWYPSVRLFRQPRMGDWTTVARAVAEALEAMATSET